MSEINNTHATPVDFFALGNMNSIADMGVAANTAGPLQFGENSELISQILLPKH